MLDDFYGMSMTTTGDPSNPAADSLGLQTELAPSMHPGALDVARNVSILHVTCLVNVLFNAAQYARSKLQSFRFKTSRMTSLSHECDMKFSFIFLKNEGGRPAMRRFLDFK